MQRRPEWIDVREIRDRMGMSQIHFSVVFGIPVATLRHWESGERKPGIPALVLLHVIARHPHAVIGALKAGKFKRRYRQPLAIDAVKPVTKRTPAPGLPDGA
jgi:transcriptional regulator with XRE-family HTH domain